MSGKHTPGPWTTDDSMVWGPDQEAIATLHDGAMTDEDGVCYPPDLPIEANARLIAAAPEMLEALRACRPVLNQRIAAQVEAAIAKAEGGGS